jgi:DNA-binding winged helix-turn-helix (wHTH) protein
VYSSSRSSGTRLRFGLFEVDLIEHQLRKRGLRIHLQEKPFKILEMLLAARGRLVTRKELASALWPALHVSFDQSLNTAVNALRQALGDSSKSVRFIETRPGLGYSFLAPVEEIEDTEAVPAQTELQTELISDYRTGRHFQERFNEIATRQAMGYFESVIERDETFAPALAALADSHTLLALLNVVSPDDAHQASHSLLTRVYKLAPNRAEVEAARARHHRLFHLDRDVTRESVSRALRLDPQCSEAHRQNALALTQEKRFDDAIAAAQTAMLFDPVSLANNTVLAWVLFCAGKWQASYEQAWKTLAIDGGMPFAQYLLGLASEQLGLGEDALSEFQNARQTWGDNPAALSALAHAAGSSGDAAQAEEIVSLLEYTSQTRYVSPYWLAVAYAGLGERLRALRAIERSYAGNDIWRSWISFDPRLKKLES